jgi:putative phosphoribosyl transferase
MNAISSETAATSAPGVSTMRQTEQVVIPINGVGLSAELVVPVGAQGIVLFIVAAGCVRETSRTSFLARAIETRGVATLSFSLLTGAESRKDGHSGYWSFELDLLTHRLLQATRWVMQHPGTRDLGIGYIGTSTCAAAALVAAAELGYAVQGVVSRSGRPDFAGNSLPRVTAPTLLIVGERDEALVPINERAFDRLRCRKQLSVVPGAGHLFDEPGTLEQVGELAADWFRNHLQAIKRV